LLSTSVVGFHCTTPAASSSRTPPSRPRASARSRGSACGPHDVQRGHVSLLVANLPRHVARRRGGFKPRAKRSLNGDDEAIVHAQELLARPATLHLVAGFARGLHEQASAILMQRGTAAPPLAVVGHRTRKKKEVSGLGSRRCAPSTAKSSADIIRFTASVRTGERRDHLPLAFR
jgi:hypothetical protein